MVLAGVGGEGWELGRTGPVERVMRVTVVVTGVGMVVRVAVVVRMGCHCRWRWVVCGLVGLDSIGAGMA